MMLKRPIKPMSTMRTSTESRGRRSHQDAGVSRSCSNCAANDDLYLVTIGGPGSEANGRTLLYCPRCRVSNQHQIDISWPLGLLTPGTFLELYRTGRTESDPRIAVEIVFGRGNAWIADEASDILERRRLDGAA